jgi:mRNA-degrading endonuclease YafQ of YafQ-DinJ toxin-antitoxin module
VPAFTVAAIEQFLRRAAQFFRKHPDLRPRFEQVAETLRGDPFAPRLRLHPLAGELTDLHAVSLTHAYRVVVILRTDGAAAQREIVLVDIGTHDEVER